jgi:hypothetical protein
MATALRRADPFFLFFFAIFCPFRGFMINISLATFSPVYSVRLNGQLAAADLQYRRRFYIVSP